MDRPRADEEVAESWRVKEMLHQLRHEVGWIRATLVEIRQHQRVAPPKLPSRAELYVGCSVWVLMTFLGVLFGWWLHG